ncbi:MAG: PhzF family phenazine biosynthesis protein [Pacificimonas sp.]
MSDKSGRRASFRHIDAFASRAFEGNSAAIYRADEFPCDRLMLKIAREHNLSETAWIVPDESGEADYQLRWFTPAVEVEMCGHATLASGHVVLTEETGRDSVSFKTLRGAGILHVARDGDAYAMSLPAWDTKIVNDHPLETTFGTKPQELRVTTTAAEDSFLARFANEAEVRALSPDFGAMATQGNLLVIATAEADAASDYDVVSRVFVPGAGINEDPVTGAAHAILTPYWAKALGRDGFHAFQASERGGYLDCRLDGDRAILGGTCVDVIEGTLLLD